MSLSHTVLVIAWFQPLADVPSGENTDPALRTRGYGRIIGP
ncbi:hypothetical protein ACIQF5_30275 [Streptomyces goshikiensis]